MNIGETIILDYQIYYIVKEENNNNNDPSSNEALVHENQTLVFNLSFNHTFRLMNYQETDQISEYNIIAGATAEEEFVVPFHDFLSLPLHNARRMISSMGVDHQTTEYCALELSSFVSNKVTEDPRFATARQIKVFLAVLLGTPYNDLINQERLQQQLALTESAQVIRTTPASKSSIESLKEVKIESLQQHQDQCSICLKELSYDDRDCDGRDDQKMVQMPCSHVYHKTCIVRWLETSHMCPLCRYAMPVD